MSEERAKVAPAGELLEIARTLEVALRDLTEDDLRLRGGSNGWSVGENVHHLVETYLAACTVVIAGVNTNGYAYDCSWMNLDLTRMERMGYSRGPVAPAIALLSALCGYLAELLKGIPEALGHEVKLLEAPGSEPYLMTVAEVVRQEGIHARHHLQEIADTLKQRSV